VNEIVALMLAAQPELERIGREALLVFLRTGGAVAALPGLGEQSVPARIRLALALMLTAAVYPAAQERVAGLDLARAFLPEMLVGLLLGLMVRLFVLALQTAGSIAANATSLSQLFPSGPEPQPAVSTLLVMAGLAIAFELGLHVRIVAYLAVSYDLFAAGRWPDSGILAAWSTGGVAQSFRMALGLAMPFVIAALLYNLALGVINRAMPQLMVSFVGAPALSLGGLALIALVAPLMLAVWVAALHGFLAAPSAAP
jgi:flagellar biosynthetic protein FliR